jgi:uncharacterized repeat protein (TIGR03803 family)
VLHRFNGSESYPQAGLTDVNGTFYGTTSGQGSRQLGTVYSISQNGVAKTLYRFKGGPSDGSHPTATLLSVDGRLYGTTFNGGAHDLGTVYALSLGGKETLLYSFTFYEDAANPDAGLVDVNGMLYGTTEYGGSGSCYAEPYIGCGTVYSITTTGSERVLHSFTGYGDGKFPQAPLLSVKGTLYGTTYEGGTGGGGGTVYRISTSGDEKVLHSFKGVDGAFPWAGLIDVNGTLYGTTQAGGIYSNCTFPYTCGTIFRITTTGRERVLHSFANGSDGAWPTAPLFYVKGALYGTTWIGGAGGCSCGTVYRANTLGSEKVLYSFHGGSDGGAPLAGLIYAAGQLYGTSRQGGGSGCVEHLGCGTVFELSP